MIMFVFLVLSATILKWNPPSMVDVLDNLSPATVLPAMDANLGSYCLHFGRLPGAETHGRGYRVAILTSSPDGFNAYQRMGFQTHCTVSRYRWRPTPPPLAGTAY
jgi:hypothetical protein